MSELERYSAEMLPAIEETMQGIVRQFALSDPGYSELHSMLAYHMGWEGEGTGIEARGKRIRPLILLLCCTAAGGNWRAALPAAAAVELLHNFSLIHDDIEDHSSLRRGRPTVWSRWGIPQAINAGDALYSISHLAIFMLAETCPPACTLEAARLLQRTCLELTQGQYLDMAFESRPVVDLDTYWQMIRGKTAALLAACCEIGVVCANPGSSPGEMNRDHFRTFGLRLGEAFQAYDDILGIWGDISQTGKSTDSDLAERKKTLPILFGLQKGQAFAARWQGEITPSDATELAKMLEDEGALAYAQDTANALTQAAESALLQALEPAQTPSQRSAGQALFELAKLLLKRRK